MLEAGVGKAAAGVVQLEAENHYLREEIGSAHQGGGMTGESAATESIRCAIETAAPSDGSVLVTGETGTGKEVAARGIHALSGRSDHPMIKVNCASISRDLFESEFFGHVRGAFTGALRDRVGRFELADGGTLFLDEVGEIPTETQSKLLRVLQEGEFERVGDERTCRVDMRVIAATNRDLRAEIAEGRFRQNLHCRLNVFPIEVAPLRDRVDDLVPLAHLFLDEWARRRNARTPRLKVAGAGQLEAYPWPGNVRELQNVIERALVTARGSTLVIDLFFTDATGANHRPSRLQVSESDGDSEFLTEAEMGRMEREN